MRTTQPRSTEVDKLRSDPAVHKASGNEVDLGPARLLSHQVARSDLPLSKSHSSARLATSKPFLAILGTFTTFSLKARRCPVFGS